MRFGKNAMVSFDGIPLAAADFYAGLEADNSKAWWTAHKGDYERLVREPIEALAAALAPEFGDGKLFRPYRDVRFSADKTPYKNHQGLIFGRPNGAGFYVQIGAEGLSLGGGFHAHGPAQTVGYRTGVDQDGTRLAGVVTGLTKAGYELLGETLKTAPRGYAADHPHVDLLRRKELMVIRRIGTPAWLATRGAATRIATTLRQVSGLVDWLDTHVPVEPARERPARR